jgi:hypothetical protein
MSLLSIKPRGSLDCESRCRQANQFRVKILNASPYRALFPQWALGKEIDLTFPGKAKDFRVEFYRRVYSFLKATTLTGLASPPLIFSGKAETSTLCPNKEPTSPPISSIIGIFFPKSP